MKQFKSFVAIALAATIGLGFTSCKKDDPEPKPEPTPEVTYKFQNKIGFSTELVDCYDITVELTGLDGKKTTTNIKDCPTEKYVEKGLEKEFTIYVFSKTEETKTVPAETKLKVTYKYNGYVPTTEDVYMCIVPDFSVGASAPKTITNSRTFAIDEYDKLADLAKTFEENYGTYNMNVAKDGTPSIKGGN